MKNNMENVLEVNHLSVYYKERGTKRYVIEDVSFSVKEGEIVGLVGKSGCGKSTLSKAVLGMLGTIEGEVKLHDEHPMMVFQDPYSSLNPSKTVKWHLKEVLRACHIKDKAEVESRILDMMEKVELPVDYLKRYPAELSGGQRQRVAIAMALIVRPKLIIADEPVSALDVTVAHAIMELIMRLHITSGTSFIFISHDMDVIYQMCDRVYELKDGKLIRRDDL